MPSSFVIFKRSLVEPMSSVANQVERIARGRGLSCPEFLSDATTEAILVFRRDYDAARGEPVAFARLAALKGVERASMLSLSAGVAGASLDDCSSSAVYNRNPAESISLESLNPIERLVLTRRLCSGDSWPEITAAFDLSERRVRDIYNGAISRLRASLSTPKAE